MVCLAFGFLAAGFKAGSTTSSPLVQISMLRVQFFSDFEEFKAWPHLFTTHKDQRAAHFAALVQHRASSQHNITLKSMKRQDGKEKTAWYTNTVCAYIFVVDRHGIPSTRGGTPSIRHGTPSTRGGTPSIRHGTPSTRGGTPSIRHGTPSIFSPTC